MLDDKLGISLDEADFDEILMCVPQLQTSVMSHKKIILCLLHKNFADKSINSAESKVINRKMSLK